MASDISKHSVATGNIWEKGTQEVLDIGQLFSDGTRRLYPGTPGLILLVRAEHVSMDDNYWADKPVWLRSLASAMVSPVRSVTITQKVPMSFWTDLSKKYATVTHIKFILRQLQISVHKHTNKFLIINERFGSSCLSNDISRSKSDIRPPYLASRLPPALCPNLPEIDWRVTAPPVVYWISVMNRWMNGIRYKGYQIILTDVVKAFYVFDFHACT